MAQAHYGGSNKVVAADETFVGGKAKNRAFKSPPSKEAPFAFLSRLIRALGRA